MYHLYNVTKITGKLFNLVFVYIMDLSINELICVFVILFVITNAFLITVV